MAKDLSTSDIGMRERVKNDPLHIEDPLATTLFGYPPQPPDVCRDCYTITEIYQSGLCWMCWPYKRPRVRAKKPK